MRTLNIKGTVVLDKNVKAFANADIRFIVNQGGTRSSKTFSLAQLFVITLMQTKNKVLTIARKTMPSLKTSVMRDFFEILRDQKIYDEALHNKTEHTYRLHGNLVEFMSLDLPQKKRGAKRDYLWLNEANEFTYEDFMQLNMRTSEKVILDYNPSDEFHWIYDRVVPRDDTVFIQSTYKDNPFLPVHLINTIEDLQNEDDNYWRIYGLGEKGQSSVTIFTKWDVIPAFPEDVDDIIYGIDFGFNHPSVILRIGVKDAREVYIDELLYATKLTNSDLIEHLKTFIPESERATTLIKADGAEPDRIKEICDAGFNCEPARKGKGSVKDSIDVVQRFNLHITKTSPSTIKEVKGYKWRVDRDGHTLDEPVKFMDHSMDSIRYAIGDGLDMGEFVKDSVQGSTRDTAKEDQELEAREYASMGAGGTRDTSSSNMEDF